MAKRNPAPKAPRKPKTPKAATALEVVEAVIGKAEAKPKASRSKYQPAMCATIIALGKTGKSKAQCAAYLDISRSTFDRYLEAHEEFREAWELADTYAQAFWEDIGLGGVGNGRIRRTCCRRRRGRCLPKRPGRTCARAPRLTEVLVGFEVAVECRP